MRKRSIVGVLVAATLVASIAIVGNGSTARYAKANPNEQQLITAETDQAFKEVLQEEQYIVDLVSSITKMDLDTDDWQICLNFLEANYDELLNNESVDEAKVMSYIEAYRYVKYEQQLASGGIKAESASLVTNTETGAPEETGTNSYNPQKAVEYMEKYYEEYNPAFPDFNEWGGDCANFVSQCLNAGGKQMVGSTSGNFNNWFCRTNVAEEFSKSSSTWRGASAFASFWKRNAISCRDFGQEYFESREAFQELYKYVNPGDAMSLVLSDGRPYHTIVCSYKNLDNDGHIRFAAHTGERLDEKLYYYVKDTSITVRVYKMSNPTPEQEASYNYDLEINEDNEWPEYEYGDDYGWGDYWGDDEEDESWDDEEYDEEYDYDDEIVDDNEDTTIEEEEEEESGNWFTNLFRFRRNNNNNVEPEIEEIEIDEEGLETSEWITDDATLYGAELI